MQVPSSAAARPWKPCIRSRALRPVTPPVTLARPVLLTGGGWGQEETLQTASSTQMSGTAPTTSGHCERPASSSSTPRARLCEQEGLLDLPGLTPALASAPTPAEDPEDQR